MQLSLSLFVKSRKWCPYWSEYHFVLSDPFFLGLIFHLFLCFFIVRFFFLSFLLFIFLLFFLLSNNTLIKLWYSPIVQQLAPLFQIWKPQYIFTYQQYINICNSLVPVYHLYIGNISRIMIMYICITIMLDIINSRVEDPDPFIYFYHQYCIEGV